MLVLPGFRELIKSPLPKVTLVDFKASASALTTYTFTNLNLPSRLPSMVSTAPSNNLNPWVQANSQSLLAIIVHGIDDAITFGVASVTVGGVAMTERVDRGGATNAINTALYTVIAENYDGRTNDDIAVTFTEAVTGCAIGVLLIENVKGFVANTTSGTTTSAGLTLSPTLTANAVTTYPFVIAGFTQATAANLGEMRVSGTGNSLFLPRTVYGLTGGGMSCVGGFAVAPNLTFGNNTSISTQCVFAAGGLAVDGVALAFTG